MYEYMYVCIYANSNDENKYLLWCSGRRGQANIFSRYFQNYELHMTKLLLVKIPREKHLLALFDMDIVIF